MPNKRQFATPQDFSALLDNPAFGEAFAMVRDDLTQLFLTTPKHELGELQDKIAVLDMVEQRVMNMAYERHGSSDSAA